MNDADYNSDWPDFSATEMACRHCGETYYWPEFMRRLQSARDHVGLPFYILSGHRCALHNARVGGAPFSEHLRLAADISASGHNRRLLLSACRSAGFTGFGYYRSFLHIDLGRPRQWWSSISARDLWLT